MNLPRTASTGLLALLACTASMAHDTWLAVDARATERERLVLLLTSGDHFPRPGVAVAAARLETSECRQAGEPVPLRAQAAAGPALRLFAAPVAPGAPVACWLRLKPRTIDLTEDKVEAYLREIDASREVRDLWERMPRPRRWTETYAKNARIELGAVDAALQPPADMPGLRIERLPPTAARGADVELRLTAQGRPLDALAVSFIHARSGRHLRGRTDREGRVVFAAPAAGRWMASATDLRPVDATQGRWQSEFSTLVIEMP